MTTAGVELVSTGDRGFALPQGLVRLSRGVIDRLGHSVSDVELSRRLHDASDLISIGAPFAAMLVEEKQTTVAVDHVGLRHVYGTQQNGWAAVGTSALRLARIARAGLDLTALSVQRMVGHQLDSDTPFQGVRKLPAGQVWRIGEGRLAQAAMSPLMEAWRRDLVRAHADRLRELINGYLDEQRDVVLELSGGMDSRLILAAVPASRRPELTAFTIVHSGSRDGEVARELSRRYGMRHIQVDIAGMAKYSPAEAYEMVMAAARRQDGMGAPLSAALYEWAEREVAEAPRLSGHGGELARVGFYLLQPDSPQPTPRLADRFFRMWFGHNYGVPDEVFTEEFARASREAGQQRFQEVFARFEGDWLAATDHFFLRQRLQRWAGITITGGCEQRVILNPLLDREVLNIVEALPHQRRWGSHQAVEVMRSLDPELMKVPLATGMRPAALQRPGGMTRVLGERTLPMFVRKGTRKLMRHRKGVGSPAVGTPVIGQMVAQHWQENPELLEPVAGLGLVDEGFLAGLVSGAIGATVATVDFLVNLSVLVSNL